MNFWQLSVWQLSVWQLSAWQLNGPRYASDARGGDGAVATGRCHCTAVAAAAAAVAAAAAANIALGSARLSPLPPLFLSISQCLPRRGN